MRFFLVFQVKLLKFEIKNAFYRSFTALSRCFAKLLKQILQHFSLYFLHFHPHTAAFFHFFIPIQYKKGADLRVSPLLLCVFKFSPWEGEAAFRGHRAFREHPQARRAYRAFREGVPSSWPRNHPSDFHPGGRSRFRPQAVDPPKYHKPQ